MIKSLNDGHFHPPFEKFIRFSLFNILLALSSHDYLKKTSPKSLKIMKISTSAAQVELFGITVKRGSDDTEISEERKNVEEESGRMKRRGITDKWKPRHVRRN